MGCGITTGLGAVFNAAAVEAGSSVAVVGCGHLGLWMIQGARVAGARQIIAVEPRPNRRAVAEQLGATDLVDPDAGDPVEQVQALTEGRGSDYTLEAAGPPGAQAQAIAMTRRAGTVVLTGLETMGSMVTLSQVDFALRGKTVRSCQNGMSRMRRDIPRYVRMLEEGVVTAAPIITNRYGLEEINDALAASDRRDDLSGVIVLGDSACIAFPGPTRLISRSSAVRRRGPARSAAHVSLPTTPCSATGDGGTCASASVVSPRSSASRDRPSAPTSRSASRSRGRRGREAPCWASTSEGRSRTSWRSATAAST